MSIISRECLQAYREAFPESDCFYGEPSSLVVVQETDSEEAHIQPESETEAQFLGRIQRSKSEGRNLFYEEWPLLDYEPDNLY